MTKEVDLVLKLLKLRGITADQQRSYSDRHIPAWARFDLFDALGLHPDPEHTPESIYHGFRAAYQILNPTRRVQLRNRGFVPSFPTYEQICIAREYLEGGSPNTQERVIRAHQYLYNGVDGNGWRSSWNPYAQQGTAAILQPIPGIFPPVPLSTTPAIRAQARAVRAPLPHPQGPPTSLAVSFRKQPHIQGTADVRNTWVYRRRILA